MQVAFLNVWEGFWNVFEAAASYNDRFFTCFTFAFPPQANPADFDMCRHNISSQIVTKEITEMHSSWKKCCLYHLIIMTVAPQLYNCKRLALSKVSLRRLQAFCYLCSTPCINNQSDSVWAEKDVYCVVTASEGVQSSCKYAKEHADVTLLKYE